MNIRYLSAVVAAASAIGLWAQTSASSPAEWVRRAAWMEQHDIFNCAVDQASFAATLPLDAPLEEKDAFIEALAMTRTDKDRAALMLAKFIDEHPASMLRMQAAMALADCHYGTGGDWSKALGVYSQIDPAHIDPAMRPALEYRTGYCLMMEGQWTKADAMMAKAAQSAELANAATFYRGYIAYVIGDYSRASQLLRQVNRREYPGSMADYYLAQITYLNGDFEQALAAASALLRSGAPDAYRTEAIRIAGESEFMLGDKSSARQHLENYYAQAADPEPSALYMLGLFAYDDGDFDRAIALMTPATQEDDAMSQCAYLYIGQAMLRTGDTDGAIMAFDKAMNMDFDPQAQETAYYNYSVASLQGGKVPFGSSVASFESFLQRFPHSQHAPEAQKYIIAGYFKNGDYEAALKSINSMPSPTADTYKAKQRALLMLGSQALAAGQPQKAIGSLSQCQQLAKYDPAVARQAQLLLGEALYKDGQYAKAEKELQSYIGSSSRSDANLPLAYFDLGYAQLPLKQYAAAAESFRNATRASGSLPIEVQADAYNRLGDAYYYISEFGKAAEAYDKALDLYPLTGDYSLMQKGLMEGYMRRHRAKIDLMSELMRRYPSSPLIPAAMLETTESYIQLADNASAIKVYKQLIEEYPSTSQARQGLLQMALTMHNDGNRREAAEAYKQVVARYPSSEEAVQATEALKRIYAADGRLADLQAFLSSIPDAPKMEAGEADRLTFESAEKAYITQGLADKLKSYADEFPAGAYRAKALSYLMENAQNSGDADGAYAYAAEIAENYPDHSVALDALAVKAAKEAADGRGNLALRTWKELDQKASTPYMQGIARMGIARAADMVGDSGEAIDAATKLIASGSLDPDSRTEALYLRGKAYARNGRGSEADADLAAAAANPANYWGMAAAYARAQMAYDQGDSSAAETLAKEATDADTPHSYWVARAFILLSDIYEKNGDNFKAKQYLNSLKQNYPGSEADIFEMIDKRMK